MRTRVNVVAAALLVVGFVAAVVAVPAAQAQAPCTAQSMTGTYAFYERGSSAILNSSVQPYPFHWAGAFAPFVVVGEITIGPDGVGNGFFWLRAGSYKTGLDPVPFQVTVTEMNADCTGKFTTTLSLPGGLSPTIVERVILMDNGREYRAIPTSIVNGITTSAWVHEGHRISKPGETLATCGPQTARGTYVSIAENLVWFREGMPIFADVVMSRTEVSMTGDFSGTFYEKLGPAGGIELPTWGTTTVNPDCSFATTMNIDIAGVPVTVPVRGVFFDGGKKMYMLNMNQNPEGTLFSFGQGQRVGK